MSVSVRVDGLPRLKRVLLTITQEGRRTAQREVMRASLRVQARAKELAPVDTGRLRNSIAVEIENDGLAAVVGTNVEYAPFVEFGTSRMRPRPYLHPAWEEEMPRFIAAMRREFGAEAVRAAR